MLRPRQNIQEQQLQLAFMGESEGGPLSIYTPPTSCTCRYEATVDASSCATCSPTTTCATGVCRDGYCEEF